MLFDLRDSVMPLRPFSEELNSETPSKNRQKKSSRQNRKNIDVDH
jgi:hypothetical protein